MKQTIHTTATSAIEESVQYDITARATVECELDLLIESDDISVECDWNNNTITTYWGTTEEGYEWAVRITKEMDT
jgi:hypothetical protein